MRTIKNYFLVQYHWYDQNLSKIIFIAGLHFISSYIVALPYINIFTSLFSFLPYFFDYLAILILFRPSKDLILMVGLSLFIFGFFAAPLRLNVVLEVLGQVSFFTIGTYVVLSLKEIKKD